MDVGAANQTAAQETARLVIELLADFPDQSNASSAGWALTGSGSIDLLYDGQVLRQSGRVFAALRTGRLSGCCRCKRPLAQGAQCLTLHPGAVPSALGFKRSLLEPKTWPNQKVDLLAKQLVLTLEALAFQTRLLQLRFAVGQFGGELGFALGH